MKIPDGYKVEYKKGQGNWTSYIEKIVVGENTTIYTGIYSEKWIINK